MNTLLHPSKTEAGAAFQPPCAAPDPLLQQLPGIAWTVDRDLRFTSRAGTALSALPVADEALPADMYEAVGSRDATLPPIRVHLRALRGEAGSYEWQWAGRTLHCRVGPLRDEAGRITGAAGLALDITERKAVEEGLSRARDDAESLVRQLRESEGRSRTLLASLPQRIFFKDAEGVFVQVNELFARDFGLLPDELLGKTDHDFFPPELAEKYRADDRRIMESGETETLVEFNVVGSTPRVVEVVKKPVIGDDGEILGVLGVFTDITERKRMEEELAYERHLLHTLMDNLPDLIYFKDTASRFTRINRAHARALGLAEPGEAVGKTDFDFFPADQSHEFCGDEREIFETGRPLLDKIEVIRTATLGMRWFSATKVPVFHEGEVVGLVGVSRDVTDRVKADLEMKKVAEELRRSNEDLQQFAYVASHDLQEPLRMVASYTQLLARRYRDRLDDDANEFIQFAVDGATRMQGLINDLLQYSRVGTRGVAFERLDLRHALDRSVANLQVAIEESGAAITHDPLPVVDADPGQMAQLFQNLVGNALKFRGEQPPVIHVGCERSGGEWVISVRDNGIGIDPQYAERIFLIFQRLHGKGEYPGSGIGLSICKKIVTRHGGRIWVESAPEGGSVFCFTLPGDDQEGRSEKRETSKQREGEDARG